MATATPEKLGKYEILDKIDRGSMGTVYVGHDPYINRKVAVKVAHNEALKDKENGEKFRKMFFNEAHTAGTLTHPNIISIYDAGVDDDNCYIVMELVEGGETLKTYCRNKNILPLVKSVEIMLKCAKALEYAHKQNVIHRDIKPSNILVTKDMEIQIADFSIAQIQQADITQTSVFGFAGSPKYMSPEQLNENKVDQRTDLFSLGIVMYELLTGQHPFEASNFSSLIKKILNDDPYPLIELCPNLPDILIKIFEKATRKKPKDRYQSGLDFAIDLNKAFEILGGSKQDISKQEKLNIAEKRLNVVKKISFFKGFPESELREIVDIGSWHDYKMGQEIITEGDIDDCFYIITDGQVGVAKKNQPIRALDIGDCFGEMGYLTKTNRTATVKALSSTTLFGINSSIMSDLSQNCQVRFLKVFLKTLVNRLSLTTDEITSTKKR